MMNSCRENIASCKYWQIAGKIIKVTSLWNDDAICYIRFDICFFNFTVITYDIKIFCSDIVSKISTVPISLYVYGTNGDTEDRRLLLSPSSTIEKGEIGEVIQFFTVI